MLEVSASAFRQFVDHDALISGLESALAGRSHNDHAGVPYALVAALGADLLHAASGDKGAMRIRWDSQTTARLATSTAVTTMGGVVPVNAILLAAILGRRDLAGRFREQGRFSLDAGLQWLILHGICEHRLWHFVDGALRHALLRPVVDAFLVRMPALGVLVLRERPELRRRFIRNGIWQAAAFQTWLRQDGLDTYRLFWLVPTDDLAGWPMHGWATRKPSPTHDPAQPRLKIDGAVQALQRRLRDWQAHDRPDVVTEIGVLSAAGHTLVEGTATSSPDGWLRLPQGRFTFTALARARHSPFVMIEVMIPDDTENLIGAATWDGQALPVWLHRAGASLCAILRVPTRLDHEPRRIVHVQIARTDASTMAIDLIRIWNL